MGQPATNGTHAEPALPRRPRAELNTERVELRVTPSILARIDEACATFPEGMSLSQYIRKAIIERLTRDEAVAAVRDRQATRREQPPPRR